MNRFASFILAYEPLLVVPLSIVLIISSPISWIGLLAFFPWLVRWRYKGYLTVRTPFDLAFAIFFAGLIFGFYPSIDLKLSIEALRGYLGAIIIYYVIVNNVSPRRWTQWLVAISGVLILGTLFSLTTPTKVTILNSWIFEMAKSLPKVSYLGYAPHLNNLAGVLSVFASILAGVVFFSSDRSQRVPAIVLGVFFGLAVLITSSRAGWMGLGCALMIIAIRKSRWFLLVFLASVVFLALAISSGLLASKELLEIGSGTTLISRAQLWESTLDMLGDMPITGVGLGSFPLVYRLYVSPAQPYVLTHPHNSLLQLYTDTGLIGMAALLVGAIAMLRYGIRLIRTSPAEKWYGHMIGTFAGFFALVFHSVFESSGVAVAADAVGNYHYTVIPVVFVLAGLLVSAFSLNEKSACGTSIKVSVAQGLQEKLIAKFNGISTIVGYQRFLKNSPFVFASIIAIVLIGNGSLLLGVFFRNFGNVELTKALLQEASEEQDVVERFGLSMRFLVSASNWNPSDIRVLRSLGRMSFEVKDYTSAAEYLEEYLARSPYDAIGRTQLGFAYAASGLEERANQEWLLGGTAGYFYEEARKSLEGQDFQQAYKLSDRAVKLSPQLPGPLYIRGRALTFLGKTVEAATSLYLAVELYDYLGEAGPEAMIARGHYYSIAGGWRRAVEAYEAVTLHKNSTKEQKFEAYEGMGKSLYRGLGRPIEAIEAYMRAAELAPENLWEPLNIGDILRDQGDVEQAREWYAKAADLEPESPEVSHRVALSYVAEGRILMARSKWTDSTKAFGAALEIDPDLAEAHFGIGEVLVLEKQDFKEAEAHFLQATQLGVGNRDLLIRSYTYLSTVAQMSNRPLEARQWLAKAEEVRRS